jgi:hypothetical protein
MICKLDLSDLKMVYLLLITSPSSAKGYQHLTLRARKRAILLMTRLLRSDYRRRRHHVAATSDHGLIWVVDNGASRHFSAVSSDITSLTLDDKLIALSGIDCKITEYSTINLFVHGRLGKPVHMQLLNVLYVP